MRSPEELIDCPYCDGQNWPEDTHCFNCKKQIKSDEEIKKMIYIEEQLHDLSYADIDPTIMPDSVNGDY